MKQIKIKMKFIKYVDVTVEVDSNTDLDKLTADEIDNLAVNNPNEESWSAQENCDACYCTKLSCDQDGFEKDFNQEAD